MAALMDGMRNNPPAKFGSEPVKMIADYLTETVTEDGTVRPTGLPRSNVLYYRLQNGDVIVARPSGTEPKIKFYYLLQAQDRTAAEAKLKSYQETLDALAK
jgi:phosphoglucomutase